MFISCLVELTASESWDLEAVADISGISPTARMPLSRSSVPAATLRSGNPVPAGVGRSGHPAPLVAEKSIDAQVKLAVDVAAATVGVPHHLSPPGKFLVLVVLFRNFLLPFPLQRPLLRLRANGRRRAVCRRGGSLPLAPRVAGGRT